jgi:hypothetical protein
MTHPTPTHPGPSHPGGPPPPPPPSGRDLIGPYPTPAPPSPPPVPIPIPPPLPRGDIAVRVAAGVAWLDENVPDWLGRVDPLTLDLSDDCGCVLGQLFGLFEDGLGETGLSDPYALGFHGYVHRQYWRCQSGTSWGDVLDEFRGLTQAWREAIAARQASHV